MATTKLKVSQLKKLEECGQRFQYSLMFNETEDERFSFINSVQDVVKQAVIKGTFDEGKSKIEEMLLQFKDEWFDTVLEKEQEINYHLQLFTRYLDFEKREFAAGKKLLLSNVHYGIPITLDNEGGNLEVTGLIDFVFQKGKDIEAVKLLRSAPALTSRAKKEENKPEYDIELALMYSILKDKYKGLKVSYYHLKHKDDEKLKLAKEFNDKPNKSIVTAAFNTEKHTGVIRRIQSTLQLDNSAKNKKDCQFCSYSKLCVESPVINQKSIKPLEKKVYRRPVFNEEQQKAINHYRGPSRIAAIPGSGKTAVMAHKVEEYLRQGVKPSEILCVTFTNKAARELEERIAMIIREEKIDSPAVPVKTYNGFGFDILKENAERLGHEKIKLVKKPVLYRQLKEAIEMYPVPGINYTNLYHPIYGMMKKISEFFTKTRQARVLEDWESFMVFTQNSGYTVEQLIPLFASFQRVDGYLKAYGYISYHDQVTMAISLFDKYPQILRKYQDQYQFILVDEYQDTDPFQATLLYMIADKHGNINICGDDDQALYNWRGADNSNILKFHEHFPYCKDIILNKNYRSVPVILENSEAVINNNKQRLENKRLIATRQNVGKLAVVDKDLSYLPTLVEECLKDYVSGDIAVIGRTNGEIIQAYEVLKNQYPVNHPKRLLIDDKLFHVLNDTLALIVATTASEQRLGDYLDDISLMNLLLFGNIIRDIHFPRPEQYSGLRLWDHLLAISDDFNGYVSILRDVSDFLVFNNPLIVQHTVRQILGSIYHIDLVAHENFFLTIDKIIEEEEISNLSSLHQHLNTMIRLYDDTVIDESDDNAISFFTSHGSKGKEFPIVILLGRKFCVDDKTEDVEESRRVLYVAATRAMDQLYILDYGRKDNVTYLIDEMPIVQKSKSKAVV